VLVLVVVLVLVSVASAPKREPDPSAIILFHYSDREIGRILEHEHEHDFLIFSIAEVLALPVSSPHRTSKSGS